MGQMVFLVPAHRHSVVSILLHTLLASTTCAGDTCFVLFIYIYTYTYISVFCFLL